MKFFLKLDLMGIVVMIFVLAFVGIWIGFSRFTQERVLIFSTTTAVFALNFLLSLTPCYAEESFEKVRIGMNILILLLLFSLALAWFFFFADSEEV